MAEDLLSSRIGALLYSELPEIYRFYDDRRPAGAGAPLIQGDTELLLHGFGRLLDRYDATLAQYYADGFVEPIPELGGRSIQPWLLEYMAALFGARLRSPTHGGRMNELRTANWLARRRGTLLGFRQGVEAVLEQASVVVRGQARILRSPSMRDPVPTHFEMRQAWHPDDAVLLREPLPAGGDEVEGFDARRTRMHAGLPVGTPMMGRAMRARDADLGITDAERRPGPGQAALIGQAFVVRDLRGRPCFADHFDDRTLRTPDYRRSRKNRRRHTMQHGPLATTAFVRPPEGIFTSGQSRATDAVTVEDFVPIPATVVDPAEMAALREDRPIMADPAVVHAPAADIVIGTADPADGFRSGADALRIEGLRLEGTLVIEDLAEETVELVNCAIRGIAVRSSARDAHIVLRHCIVAEISCDTNGGSGSIELEYVSVTGPASLHRVHASDCLFADLAVIAEDGPGSGGCLRYSRLGEGALDGPDLPFSHYACSAGPASFIRIPCLPAPGGGTMTRPANFGEPGYGVLDDDTDPAVAQGAEDGGEVGAYHDRAHLAALAAAVQKAGDTMPPSQSIYIRYDNRLLLHGAP